MCIMKSIFLFSAFAMLSLLSVNGQRYYYDDPYYPEGTTWVEEHIDTLYGSTRYFRTYEIGEDTLVEVGGTLEPIYKPLRKIYCDGQLLPFLLWDGNRVSLYGSMFNVYGSDFFDLYDFYYEFWNSGGLVFQNYYINKELGIEKPVLVLGSINSKQELKQMFLLDGTSCAYYTDCVVDGEILIYGIGTTAGIVSYPFLPLPDGTRPRLYSFTRNGVLLYQRGMMSGLDDVADKASGYHVVNDGAGCTVSGEGDFSAVAYDLSGRQLWQGRSDGGLIVVPAESLDDGVMLLRLQGDAGTETIKLMN